MIFSEKVEENKKHYEIFNLEQYLKSNIYK